jgi:hypothetical protein
VVTVRKNELTPSEELRQKMTGKSEFQFPIGNLAIGEHILDTMGSDEKFDDFVWASFARHCTCDWGDNEELRKVNDQAMKKGGSLISEYKHPEYGTLRILTEKDRSTTVIGGPLE